jgi:hypothetical protein
MNESENFLARWSRLKHETALEASAVSKPPPVAALQVVEEPPTPAFDPASLPAIELIDATTDIRPFLEACVPEELTRAALRSTWSADPAIRDFIGIAESQWDFNDPASIPGFGVYAAVDYLGSLAVHGVGSLDAAAEIPPECSQMVDQPASEGTGPTCSDPADVAGQITAAMTDPAHEAAVGTSAGPRITRSHGGALPE